MGKNYVLLHKNTPNGFFYAHWEYHILFNNLYYILLSASKP